MAANFQIGREVGEIARQLYDPDGSGTVVDTQLFFVRNVRHTVTPSRVNCSDKVRGL
jgi:hypothetical protein